jgi:hypothetical protein
MARGFVDNPPPSKALTPPWVEQYLYHLSKGMRLAEAKAFQGMYSYLGNKDEKWQGAHNLRIRLLNIRGIQHKAMKDALYQVGHPLWGRVK